MLSVLHRGIDVMDGVDKRWKDISRAVRGAIGSAPNAEITRPAADSNHKAQGRAPTVAGAEIRVHPELAAAASSEQQHSSGSAAQAVAGSKQAVKHRMQRQ